MNNLHHDIVIQSLIIILQRMRQNKSFDQRFIFCANKQTIHSVTSKVPLIIYHHYSSRDVTQTPKPRPNVSLQQSVKKQQASIFCVSYG